MLKVLFELFMLYLLYKLVFDFIIPIYQTTKQVKQKVGEMQRNMNEQMQKQNNQFTDMPKTTSTKVDKDDYIDYEEVK
jgi:hypothetical protein